MKVILFSYYWPPSGKASLHLPLGLVRYLPEFGIEPIVITVKAEGFGKSDPTIEEKVPAGLRIYRTSAWEPFSLYRKFLGKPADEELVASETISRHNTSLSHRISLWLRLNLFIPDARIGWYPHAVAAAKRLMKEEKIDALITFGPPHSSHLAGWRLSKIFGIPHIPVLIDPWTDIAYYRGLARSRLTVMTDRFFEMSVLRKAAQVVFVTQSMMVDFANKYPFITGKEHIMYWGYDEKPFLNVVRTVEKPYKTLLHAGNIFDYQNPKKLWNFIKQYNNDTSPQLRLQFIGTVSPGIRAAILDAGLSEVTDFLGFLPYNQMLNEVCSADYLLVCATEKRHVPGKLFEYLRSGKPILAFGDDNTEVRNILTRSRAGTLYGYDEDPSGFFHGELSASPDMDYISSFERREAARNFSNKLINMNTNWSNK